MKKKEVISIFTSSNDADKEMYLHELQTAFCNYAITGNKSHQLDDFLSVYNIFLQNYKSAIDRKVSKNIEEAIVSFEQPDSEEKKKKSALTENIQIRMTEYFMNDMSYFVCLKLLYELFDKAQREREQLHEFREMTDKFPDIVPLTKEIEKHRRITVIRASEIVQGKLNDILILYIRYFNIRKSNGADVISLTSLGKKFANHIGSSGEYICSNIDQVVFKNCDELLRGIEKSCRMGIDLKLNLDGMEPGEARIIKYKYNRLIRQLLKKEEEIYPRRVIEVKDEGNVEIKISERKNKDTYRVVTDIIG